VRRGEERSEERRLERSDSEATAKRQRSDSDSKNIILPSYISNNLPLVASLIAGFTITVIMTFVFLNSAKIHTILIKQVVRGLHSQRRLNNMHAKTMMMESGGREGGTKETAKLVEIKR